MEFEFTKRMATIAKRFAEIHLQSAIEKLEEINEMTSKELDKIISSNSNDEILCSAYFNDIKIQIRVVAEYDEDEMPITGSAECRFEIDNNKLNAFSKTHLYNIPYMENLKLDIWIDSLVKTYLICKCNNHMAEKDGWCKYCFPFVMEQPDVCCCCLENEGVWAKLSCNHTLHKYCFNKIIGRKCPLCRAESSSCSYL